MVNEWGVRTGLTMTVVLQKLEEAVSETMSKGRANKLVQKAAFDLFEIGPA